MLKRLVITGIGALLGFSAAAAGPVDPVDDTGRHRDSHQLLVHQRNAARLDAAPPAVAWDEGDVAVIVDNGAIIVPPRPAKPFDLVTPSALAFTPSGDGFTVATAAAVLDPVFGNPLALGDDSSVEVPFPAGFPFLGSTHASVWVNSDGNLTFGEGDRFPDFRNAARLIGGPPRVAPFLADLEPGVGGSVHADARADRLVVTWAGVPGSGGADSNTFQAVLHQDGAIDFVYAHMETPFGVVGIAEGGNERPFNELDLSAGLPATVAAGAVFEEFGPQVLFPELDIYALSREFYRTHEDEYDFLVMFTDFPVHRIGEGVFDVYHSGVSSSTLGLGLSGVYDFTALAGSGGELESMAMMNDIRIYWPDAGKMVDPPIREVRVDCDEEIAPGVHWHLFLPECILPGAEPRARFRWFGTRDGDPVGEDLRDHGADDRGGFTLGLESAMSVLAEEVGHRWLVRGVLFWHPSKGFNGIDNFDLLGRAGLHWSTFLNARVPGSQLGGDPRASSMEGNAIADLGPEASLHLPFPCTRPGESTFTTEPEQLADGFSELDQYFMGLRRADEVGSFWYVDEPRSPVSGIPMDGFSQANTSGVGIPFCGKRVDLTVANITAIGDIFDYPPHGPRVPELGDEVDAVVDGEPVDVKTMAFILLVEPGPSAHAGAIGRVDTLRRTWEVYGNGPATGGRGRFDTRLAPAIH